MTSANLRHSRGEYYTPKWLAEIILDEAGYHGESGVRLLDPSCGPGVFLVLAIERARRHGRGVQEILSSIHGYELNPESAEKARAAYRAALGNGAEDVPLADIPVFCRDAILDPPNCEPFDILAGNPPWVRWDYLSREYRDATLPLWKRYGLFSLKGFETRLGAGKKDLSMLFTCVAADLYLRQGGTLALVITQEVFKSKGAGEGFRRFRLREDGPPLGVLRVHDFVKLQPFGDAVNKTAALIAVKGEETRYPVPYHVWERDSQGSLRKQSLVARPLGSLVGPWQTLVPGEDLSRLEGTNPYKAMLGANANPYGVFWLEVYRALPDGLVEVRNRPDLGKKAIPPVTAEIESDLVYPAVRGSDIRRWEAHSGVHVLIVQDPVTRFGYPQDLMERQYPLALAYLNQFREELLSRALYRKYHLEAGRPFYSQFNIARETFAPFKVVWKRMTTDLIAAVISRPLVPLETTAFIATDCAEEAHYLCAILNSGPVRTYVRSFSSAGRGFGTPYVINRIRIPRFDCSNPLHRELAAGSQAMHQAANEDLEREIDTLVLQL